MGDVVGVLSRSGFGVYGVALGLAVAPSPSPPTAAVDAAPVNRTGRNESFAEASMRSSVALSGRPGIDTTMFWVPCFVISDSETPAESMR
nr:hypothetical protein GCM10025699_52570 [Microbacterium flavescens]